MEVGVMTPFEIMNTVGVGVAIVISVFALIYAKRGAKANEDSAWYAARANDLGLMDQMQNIIETTTREAAQALLVGDEDNARKLEYAMSTLLLDMLKDFGNRNEDTKKKLGEYFRGLPAKDEAERQTIEHLITYALEGKLPDRT